MNDDARTSGASDKDAAKLAASFTSERMGYVCNSIRPHFHKAPSHVSDCPMCAQPLTFLEQEQSTYAAEWEKKYSGLIAFSRAPELRTCPACRWWSVRQSGRLGEIEADWDYILTPVVHDWGPHVRDEHVAVLLKRFRQRRAIDFTTLDPLTFEKLVAECMRVEFGPCEVHHVGVSGGGGDGGIDIYLIKDSVEWLIQVKRRLTDRPEPITTIRLLNGTLLREGKTHGAVVTSAPSFTRNAEDETMIRTAGQYCVKLFDRGDVLRMLHQLTRQRWAESASWKVVLIDATWSDVALPLSMDASLLLFGVAPQR